MNNCSHASFCSGCQLSENLFHPPIWDEILSYYKGKINLQTDRFSSTRYKAKLAVRPGPHSGSGPDIGLFKKNTHDVLPIPRCETHHPAINRAVSILREAIVAHSISAYNERSHIGTLRYVQLFVNPQTEQLQLVLIVNHPLTSQPFYDELLRHDLFHSIWINLQPSATNRILGDQWQLIHGEPFIWQTFNNLSLAFHPGAFSQAHLPLFEQMIQKIASWIHPTDPVLELYAGVGAIGLSLPNAVTFVENNLDAHTSFQETLKKHPEPSRFTYLCQDAKQADLINFSQIIVDPPRKGLEKDLLEKLCDHSGRLVYVSCGFESFKRDCNELQKAGWKIKEAQGYLLFPGTNHIETVTLLEKLI